MRTHRSNPLCVPRVRPLAACLAIAFGMGICAASAARDHVAAPIRPTERNANLEAVAGAAFQSIFAKSFETEPNLPAATFVVKNCDDAGPDSLRDAIAAANSLNVDSAIEFDLNAMGCSTITLSTGQITISVHSLSIGGPAPNIVTIDGGYNLGHSNRIFKHTGQGTLQLDHLALTDAVYSTAGNQQAMGGCVYSLGTAYLSNSSLDSCRAMADACRCLWRRRLGQIRQAG